jgi:hypothetical protein
MDMIIAARDGTYRLELRDVRAETRSMYRSTLRLVTPDKVLKHPFWFDRADASEFLVASLGLGLDSGRAEFSGGAGPGHDRL